MCGWASSRGSLGVHPPGDEGPRGGCNAMEGCDRVAPRGRSGAQRGQTGTRGRLKVNAETPANDAYQAASAVAMPSQPPSLWMPVDVANSPQASTKNVIVNSTKTRSTAPLTRVAATVMYSVKRPQASRNSPTPLAASPALTPVMSVCPVRYQNEI